MLLFKQYSFLNIKEIDKLIDAMYQGKDKAVDTMGGEEEFFYANNDIDIGKIDPVDSFGNSQSDKEEPEDDTFSDENFKKLKEKHIRFDKKRFNESDYKKLKRVNEDVVKDAYFKAKKDLRLHEGLLNNSYFMNSNISSKKIEESLMWIERYKKYDLNNKIKD